MIREGTAQPSGSSTVSLPTSAVLDLCDRLLGEVGRRRHLFAWLRPSGAGPEDWLVVDAYYPGNRLVVILREQPGEHDQLFRDLVPTRGLRLLEIVPAELGADPQAAPRTLAEMIARLGPAPERPREVVAAPPRRPKLRRRESAAANRTRAAASRGRAAASRRRATMEAAVARAASALAQPSPPATDPRPIGATTAAAVQRASRLAESHKLKTPAMIQRPAPVAPRRPPSPTRAQVQRVKRAANVQPVGLLAGLALVSLLVIEMYLDVALIAVSHGWVLLAFGIALEAVARALGTIAAGRAGRRGWAWACALGGSLLVAIFALFRKEGPVATDPAPLAGLMSLVAIAVIALGALIAGLGI